MDKLSTSEIKRLIWLVACVVGTLSLSVGINIGYAIQ